MHAKIKVQAPNTMGTIWIVKATQNTSVAPYQVKKVYTKRILYLMWTFIGNHGNGKIFFLWLPHRWFRQEKRSRRPGSI